MAEDSQICPGSSKLPRNHCSWTPVLQRCEQHGCSSWTDCLNVWGDFAKLLVRNGQRNASLSWLSLWQDWLRDRSKEPVKLGVSAGAEEDPI